MEKSHSQKFSKIQEILRRYGLAIAFVGPYLLFFIFFGVVPLFMGIIISFMNYNPYDLGSSSFAGFDNYANLFKSDSAISRLFWPAFGKTLLFDIIAVPCLIIVPLAFAILINKKPPLYKLFRAILYLPAVTSITIVGIIFGSIFASDKSGLVNSLFGTNIDFLGNETSRWIIILFVSIWWQTGQNFVILSAALRDVPKSLYEACEMDGGGKFEQFMKVTLPNIKGSLQLCMFTTLIGYMGLYGQPYTLFGTTNKPTLTNPQTPMILIQTFISSTSFASKTGAISALAVFFGLFVMIFSLIQKIVMKDRKGGNTREKQFNAFSAIQERKTN